MGDLWTLCAIIFFLWLLNYVWSYLKTNRETSSPGYSTGINNMRGISDSTTDIFGQHSSRTGAFSTVVAR